MNLIGRLRKLERRLDESGLDSVSCWTCFGGGGLSQIVVDDGEKPDKCRDCGQAVDAAGRAVRKVIWLHSEGPGFSELS